MGQVKGSINQSMKLGRSIDMYLKCKGQFLKQMEYFKCIIRVPKDLGFPRKYTRTVYLRFIDHHKVAFSAAFEKYYEDHKARKRGWEDCVATV